MNENKNMDPKLETALKGIYDHLTDEQKEKAKACKNMDEMMALAGEWGVELPDEVLDAVAGGIDWTRLAAQVTATDADHAAHRAA